VVDAGACRDLREVGECDGAMVASIASGACAILLDMELSISGLVRRYRSYSYKARGQRQGEEGDACDKTFSFHCRFLSFMYLGCTFACGAVNQAMVPSARTPLWVAPPNVKTAYC